MCYIMDVDTSPHTKVVQFIQNPEVLQLRQQIISIFFKKLKFKNLNTISNEGERSSKTLHGSQAERLYGKGEASMYS